MAGIDLDLEFIYSVLACLVHSPCQSEAIMCSNPKKLRRCHTLWNKLWETGRSLNTVFQDDRLLTRKWKPPTSLLPRATYVFSMCPLYMCKNERDKWLWDVVFIHNSLFTFNGNLVVEDFHYIEFKIGMLLVHRM